jgi:hypothetical protein
MRILSLGAGVQSTAVAVMSAVGELPKIDHAIFADTQWEPAAVYAHFKLLKPFLESRDIQVHVVTAGNIRENFTIGAAPTRPGVPGRTLHAPVFVVGELEERGITRRSCTGRYKIEPVEKKIGQLIGKSPRGHWPKHQVVEQWFGISLDERQRERISQNAAIAYKYPLIERRMSRQDCVDWLTARGWAAPRSACIGCPFHDDVEWLSLQPDEFADAVAVERQMQSRKVTALRGKPFLHRDRVPLDQVPLSAARTRRRPFVYQYDAFADECTGMCGT